MKLDFTTIDAFTTTRYNGNPVAIVRVPALEKQSESSTQSTGTANDSYQAELTQEQKQKIAAEFNLSEIVFLHLPAAGESFKEVNIDIFTSIAELPFAVCVSNHFP